MTARERTNDEKFLALKSYVEKLEISRPGIEVFEIAISELRDSASFKIQQPGCVNVEYWRGVFTATSQILKLNAEAELTYQKLAAGKG